MLVRSEEAEALIWVCHVDGRNPGVWAVTIAFRCFSRKAGLEKEKLGLEPNTLKWDAGISKFLVAG